MVLNMHSHIVNAFRGFHHCFRDGRMRVHCSPELLGSRFELHRHASLRDQLGRMWSNDMNAQNLVVLLLADDLDEALFLTDYARFARCGEWKSSYFNVVTLLFRFRLGQPD